MLNCRFFAELLPSFLGFAPHKGKYLALQYMRADIWKASRFSIIWRFLAFCTLENQGNDSKIMHFVQSNSPDWKPIYEAALLETDGSKLPERITAARTAILDRIEESLTSPLPSEHRAMDDALRNLRRLAERMTRNAA